jgi:AcrR family transcriptional regulator
MPTEASKSDNILAVATLLFRAKGYHATSINEVAEKARIQKASVYHHFESKESLAIAVMAKVQKHFDTSIFSYAYDEALSPEARLMEMNRALEQFFSGETTGCVFVNFAIETIDSIPSFLAPVQGYFTACSHAYRSIFMQVYNAGEANALADDFGSDFARGTHHDAPHRQH